MSQRIVHVTCVHMAQDIRIFHKQCRSLVEAGFDVTVIGPSPRAEWIDGVQIVPTPRYPGRLRRMTLGAAQAFARCLRIPGALYHFHDPELLPWMALLVLFGRSVVYDMHENLPKAILTKAWIAPALRPLISGIYKLGERVLTLGMCIVFAEESYRADYPWARGIDVLNMPCTSELAELRAVKRDKPTVCYFGAVSELRGSTHTLRALALLKQRGLDVAFECIGNLTAQHAVELRALAVDLKLDVTVHDYVPPREGWAIAAECHVGLALLHPIPNYMDSAPTKIFEYMALGLPVVASDFPLYRRIVDDAGCGFCVDPLSEVAIADALEELLRDPQRAAELGQRGREAALARYSWDVEAAKLAELYRRVLNTPPVS